MKINATSQKFTGLSNPIAISVKPSNGIMHTISVQLDNIGTKDWNEFIKLKHQLNFPAEEIEGDVLTLTCGEFNNNIKKFFINDKPVILGSDMAELRDYPFATDKDFAEYKAEEKLIVRLYTFAAKITKQMMDMKSMKADEDLTKVSKEMFANLAEAISNEDTALKIVVDAIEHPRPFQPVAAEINKFIDKTMDIFLG